MTILQKQTKEKDQKSKKQKEILITPFYFRNM